MEVIVRKQLKFVTTLIGFNLFIWLCLASCLCAQPWSGIIDSSRAVNWSNAGVPGGIPSASWTQCGSTIPAGASVSTINSAIAGCGSNQFVQLAAGNFNLAGGIVWNGKSNVALRGMGASQTFLVFSNNNSCQGLYADVCFQSTDVNYNGAPSNLGNWTAGYAKGTTSITLSSKGNLAVGTPITLDQTDDTVDTGGIFVCYAPQGVCSTNGDNGGAPRAGRSQQQIVTVTSISGSGPYTVGISPGIYMPNWTAAKTPQAWWPSSPISTSGVENLSMDHTAAEPNVGQGVGVGMFNCNGCWIKGVRSISPGRSHVQMLLSNRCTIQDSYFYLTAGHTSTSYGVEALPASDALIQNNIFQQVTAPVAFNGSCSGCVMAYNFDINNIYDSGGGVYTWQEHGTDPHAVGDENILLEGNQGAGLDSDVIHGSHHFITAFRNYWNGYQPNNGVNPTGNTNAIIIRSLNRFMNIVGNVLGAPSYHKSYSSGSATSVYSIGLGDETPNDPNVALTLLRWGNWDVVTGAARWCGNSSSPGWTTTCAAISEVPSAIANIATLIPSSTALPASFYLTSQPAWWPSSKPWPPIGPDVTGGNISGLGGHAYSIPAADCYANVMSGPANGTGQALTFNASSCYGQTTVTSTQPPPPSGPAPPTSLSAVVQ
jgi:hypothetical protein